VLSYFFLQRRNRPHSDSASFSPFFFVHCNTHLFFFSFFSEDRTPQAVGSGPSFVRPSPSPRDALGLFFSPPPPSSTTPGPRLRLVVFFLFPSIGTGDRFFFFLPSFRPFEDELLREAGFSFFPSLDRALVGRRFFSFFLEAGDQALALSRPAPFAPSMPLHPFFFFVRPLRESFFGSDFPFLAPSGMLAIWSDS